MNLPAIHRDRLVDGDPRGTRRTRAAAAARVRTAARQRTTARTASGSSPKVSHTTQNENTGRRLGLRIQLSASARIRPAGLM
jgi:hypothetical protein